MVVLNSVLHDSRVIREALALKTKGYNITVIGVEDGCGSKVNFDFSVKLLKLRSRILLPKNIVGWSIKYLEFILRCILKTILLKPEIVHAHDLPALLPSFIVSRIIGNKLIYDAHELFSEMTADYESLQNRLWRKIEKKLLLKVDGTIAANQSRARIMKEDYGCPNFPTVIMNIPSRRPIARSGRIKKYLEEMGIFGKKIVLYQGAIMIDRNIDVLIKSVSLWKEEAVLVLMGFGNRAELLQLEKITCERRITDRVFFYPPVPSEELLSHTSCADIGVVIYKNNCRNNYYCAPNKLFEYAASNVKIAGCDFPEVRAIVGKYAIGDLFSPENEVSIANCINKLLNSKIDEKQFLKLFVDYSWENEVQKLYRFYEMQ